MSSLAFVSLNLLFTNAYTSEIFFFPVCHLFLCNWGWLNNFLRNCWQDVAQEQSSSRTRFLIKIAKLSCVVASSWFKVVTLGWQRSVASSYPFFSKIGQQNLYICCKWSLIQDHLDGKMSLILKGIFFFFLVTRVMVTILVYLHIVLSLLTPSSDWGGWWASHISYLFYPSTQMNWDIYLLFWNFPWLF